MIKAHTYTPPGASICSCSLHLINIVDDKHSSLPIVRVLIHGHTCITSVHMYICKPICPHAYQKNDLSRQWLTKIIAWISLWQRRSCNVPIPEINSFESADECRSESAPEFCIDAGRTGNIARFINHSCCPNLFVQCVLSTHHDIKLARVMLFAADNIPPLQVVS